MNRTAIIRHIASQARVSQRRTAEVIRLFVSEIKDSLAQGERVRIAGLGYVNPMVRLTPKLPSQKLTNRYFIIPEHKLEGWRPPLPCEVRLRAGTTHVVVPCQFWPDVRITQHYSGESAEWRQRRLRQVEIRSHVFDVAEIAAMSDEERGTTLARVVEDNLKSALVAKGGKRRESFTIDRVDVSLTKAQFRAWQLGEMTPQRASQIVTRHGSLYRSITRYGLRGKPAIPVSARAHQWAQELATELAQLTDQETVPGWLSARVPKEAVWQNELS